MNDTNLKLCESDYRFMSVIWENEPVQSGKLVELCNEKLGWKKPTTYTTLKKLCDHIIWINNGELVMQGNTNDVLAAYKQFLNK